MRKIERGILILLALSVLVTTASYSLYTSTSSGVVASRPPLVNQSMASTSGDKRAESKDIVAKTGEIQEGYAYPGHSTPPLAVKRALDWTNNHISAGVPIGAAPAKGSKEAAPGTQLSANSWTSLGPTPLDSSQGSGSGYRYGKNGGRVDALALASNNMLFAGTAGGGVWVSKTCCASSTVWQPLGDPYVASSVIGAIAVDPTIPSTSPATIYAGTGDSSEIINHEPYSSGLDSRGVLKSTDSGATWTVLGENTFAGANGGDPQRITALAVDNLHPQTILAGTQSQGTDSNGYYDSGLYISNDGGSDWLPRCSITSPNGHNTSPEVVDDIVLYHGIGLGQMMVLVALGNPLTKSGWVSPAGIYRATLPASGCPSSWQQIRSISPAQGYNAVGRVRMAMASNNSSIIYVAAATPLDQDRMALPSSIYILYRTTDGGTNWSTASWNNNPFVDCVNNPVPESQAWYDMAIRVDPTDTTGHTIYLGTTDLYKSTDSGDSFTDLSDSYTVICTPYYGYIHPDVHAIMFLPSGGNSSQQPVIATDGGLYSCCAQNGHFIELNDTLSNLQFYGGDITPNFATDPNAQAFGGLQDQGDALYNAASPQPRLWTLPMPGDGIYPAIDPGDVQHYWYAEGAEGRLDCSVAGPGGTWHTCVAWSPETENIRFAAPFVLDHHNCGGGSCQHLALGTYRVWESVSKNPNTQLPVWYPNDYNLTKGSIHSPCCLHTVRALAFAPTNTAYLYAGTADGNVQYTYNAGSGGTSSWVDLTQGNAVMPNRSVSGIAVNPGDSTIAFVAFDGFDENTPTTPGHLYMVSCSGDTQCGQSSISWANKSGSNPGGNGNLPDIPAYSVVVNPNNHAQVFVGTEVGVFYTDNINAQSPTWQKLVAGMPVVPVYGLTVDTQNSALVAWTYGRGAYGILLPQQPLSWQWVQSDNMANSSDNYLYSVASVSSSQAWAVGYYHDTNLGRDQNLILEYSGGSWNALSGVPNVGQGTNFLNSVSATAANDAWAVGGAGTTPVALHWNGTVWSLQNAGLPNNSLPTAVYADSSGVWLVGYFYGNSPVQQTFTALWNSASNSWYQVPSPNHNESCVQSGSVYCINILTGIVNTGSASAWAVGWWRNPQEGTYHPYTLRWDGSGWQIVELPNPSSMPLNSITALGVNNIWAVGAYNSFHYNGTSWSAVALPTPASGDSLVLNSISAVTYSGLEAVGYYRNTNTSHYTTLALTGDDIGNWTISPSDNVAGTNNYLNSVSADRVGDSSWAVGCYLDSSSGHCRTLTLKRVGGPFAAVGTKR